jgi:hypothetical protein
MACLVAWKREIPLYLFSGDNCDDMMRTCMAGQAVYSIIYGGTKNSGTERSALLEVYQIQQVERQKSIDMTETK